MAAMIPRETRKAAIECNNEGVRLLRSGDLGGAIIRLAKGLDIIKNLLEGYSPMEMEILGPEGESVDIDTSADMDLSFLETSNEDSVTTACYQQQPSYVFCSPIEISTETALRHLKISLLMVFNLALAHHLNGIQTSDRDQLEKALRLYECAYCISHEEEVDLSVLHAMALTNNLGHIHLVLHDTQKSQKCFEQLLATLIYFVEVSDGDNKEIENLKGFFSNATGLSMIKASAPAA
ncbi:hypothetical protein IV203_036869 [Nitzschia inconspicua]|uniref:Uncharacterized protein n=1 Tax=Nitzschia inconspicua TaxID=303405 RepID=A0A9K3PW25_9STRA|nr:hypothetical protein IV203_036869 [Nitzschia inconspicua]